MHFHYFIQLGLLLVATNQIVADTFFPIEKNLGKPQKKEPDALEKVLVYPYSSFPTCPKVNEKIDCTHKLRYRTADGTCNNLVYKWWGAAFTPYTRLLKPEYTQRPERYEFVPRIATKNNQPLPNARLVANILTARTAQSGLSSWFTFFGQFLAHDLAHTGKSPYGTCECGSTDPDCFNILTNPDIEETIRRCQSINTDRGEDCKFVNQTCIPFVRSDDVENVMDCEFEYREQYTKSTHFADLDNLYGASEHIQKNIRAFKDGMLKIDRIPGSGDKESLPVLDINKCLRTETETGDRWKATGCIYSGDSRAGDATFLSAAHLLFHRLHNYVARGLKDVNHYWSDQTLFDEARRITIAIYQNIIFDEYLPIVLGPDTMKEFSLNTLKSGYSYLYDDYLYPNGYNEFITAAFRLHNTVHTDVMDLNSDFQETLNPRVSIADFRFNQFTYYAKINSFLISATGLGTYISGFSMVSGLNHFLQITDDNSNKMRFSLPAHNIQRGRDHGIAGYGWYARLAGQGFPTSWTELNRNFGSLENLYESPAEIDLWMGLIAERADPDFLLPRTMRWIVGKNFFKVKYADRFYFENGKDKETRFTLAQLAEIRKIKFSSVQCAAFGESTNNKMPECGFFTPSSLVAVEGFNPFPFRTPNATVAEQRLENPIVSCDAIAKLDFKHWKSLDY